MTKLFYCYSPKLKDRFIEMGVECLGTGINPNTYRKYWLFLKTDNTKAILQEWNISKDNN